MPPSFYCSMPERVEHVEVILNETRSGSLSAMTCSFLSSREARFFIGDEAISS
ncbi:MAG: hypothetical protein KAT06_08020 [Gammaproteobacteria bacterium]|nr:hypothetical protein [Gammaproteobacteria bacterium]